MLDTFPVIHLAPRTTLTQVESVTFVQSSVPGKHAPCGPSKAGRDCITVYIRICIYICMCGYISRKMDVRLQGSYSVCLSINVATRSKLQFKKASEDGSKMLVMSINDDFDSVISAHRLICAPHQNIKQRGVADLVRKNVQLSGHGISFIVIYSIIVTASQKLISTCYDSLLK